MGHYKGPLALPTTIRRRSYHRAYYRDHKGTPRRSRGQRACLVPCPGCYGRMDASAGHATCWRCRSHDRKEVCACGERMARGSKQCWRCRGWLSDPRERLPVVREGNPFCPNRDEGAGGCATHRAHRHCACGLPCPPDKFACRVCIFEQARIEFKTWPLEDWEEAA